MRIGLLTTGFPRTPDDFAGYFVLGFAQALASHGHRIEVLAPEPEHPGDSSRIAWRTHLLQQQIVLHHVRYTHATTNRRLFYGAGVPENLRTRPQLAPQLLSFSVQLMRTARQLAMGWDAVVSHWALPCAWVATRCGPLPHLAVCHSADLHALSQLSLLGRRIKADIANHARCLWFVAAPQRNAFLKGLSPRRVRAQTHVSPMGFWPGTPDAHLSREQARKELGLRSERFTALTLGRWVPIKGLERAIAAVRLEGHCDLVMAGAGPLGPDLAARCGDDPRCRLLGPVTGPRKQVLLQSADALILSSRQLPGGRSEGVPTVLLEALGAGLPVIASRVGGIPSFVKHDVHVLLVPPDDTASLANALRQLRSQPELRARLARAGRSLARDYTWQALGQQALRYLDL